MLNRLMVGSLGLALCAANAAVAQQTIPGPNTAQMAPGTQQPQRAMPSPGNTPAESANPTPMPPGIIAGHAPGMQRGLTGRSSVPMPTPSTPDILTEPNAQSGQVR